MTVWRLDIVGCFGGIVFSFSTQRSELSVCLLHPYKGTNEKTITYGGLPDGGCEPVCRYGFAGF